MPSGAERVSKTDLVCGNTSSETKNWFTPSLICVRLRALNSIIMASAAEVASSSKEEFAKLNPVKSQTSV